MKHETDEKDVSRLFSYNLKRLRNLRNISQFDLALDAGVSQTFINGIENQKKNVSFETIAKLSDALNVEPYQFFLPEGAANSEVELCVKEITDSLQQFASDLRQQYFTNNKQ
jgi:transcriptional regulator with XRE-family HTH domain